jgi:hypothetical protein
MAVQDKYGTASVSSAQSLTAIRDLFLRGANIKALVTTLEVAAADDDGSVYRLFTLDKSARPLMLLIANDALTAGTVYDVSIYAEGVAGAVIADAALASVLDLSTAHVMGPSTALNGLKSVDQADLGKTMYELAGHTSINARDNYDIGLTADTVGSAAGTITAFLLFALPSE